MLKEFVERLVDELQEDRQAKVDALVSGGCTHDAYKFGCGEIHGLDIAIAQAQAMLKKVEEADDDD